MWCKAFSFVVMIVSAIYAYTPTSMSNTISILDQKCANNTCVSENVANELQQLLQKANDSKEEGNLWVILGSGSWGWANYRHQADVCHSYQVVRNHGVPDERIIVFMKDDIAFNKENPHPGVIMNHPNGSNVYKGVPKDYTGKMLMP